MSINFKTNYSPNHSFNIAKSLRIKANLARLLAIITNMANYAFLNIKDYNTIQQIPNSHLPKYIDTGNAYNWYNSFSGCSNLTSLPNPFYNMAEASDTEYMFANCANIKDASMINFGNAKYMDYTFSGCSNLITLPVIPNTARHIGYMFANCTNLVNPPELPEGIESMYDTFMGCSNLISPPVIPSTVTAIESCFSNCINMTSAPNLPDGVDNLAWTFYKCEKITKSPVIPNSVTNMCQTFGYCSNLTDPATLSENLSELYYTYSYCTKLPKAPVIPTSITKLDHTFISCESLQTIPNIHNNITNLSHAFEYCSNIQGPIRIESPNIIDATNAFYGCWNYLKQIYVHANTSTYNAFYNAMGGSSNDDWNAILKIIAGALASMYNYAQTNIPTYATMTSIPMDHNPIIIDTYEASNWGHAFSECSKLTELPNPFYNMSNATNVDNMFRNCSSVEDFSMVDFGDKITSMNNTFYGCSNMIVPPVIPTSVTNMSGTFNSCGNINGRINIYSNNITDASDLFANSSNNVKFIHSYKNTNTYNSIYNAMGNDTYNSNWNAYLVPFYNKVVNSMANYASLNIPSYSTIESIPADHSPDELDTIDVEDWSNAFNGCTSLTTLPNNFYIMHNAEDVEKMFNGCTNLVDASSVKFGNNVTSMYDTFAFCENLTVPPVIPNSVTSLSATFQSCYSLANSPVIPNSVTDMGWTFDSCSSLTVAPTLPESLESLNGTFAWSGVVTPAHIPSNVTDISMAYTDCENLNGDIYIYSNNVTNATDFLSGCTNYPKNIYVYSNSITYNTLYQAMGNNTTNTNWNATLIASEVIPPILTITFTLDGEQYQCLKGTTWTEWLLDENNNYTFATQIRNSLSMKVSSDENGMPISLFIYKEGQAYGDNYLIDFCLHGEYKDSITDISGNPQDGGVYYSYTESSQCDFIHS